RVDGARAILTDVTDEELKKACDKKQVYFLELLKSEGIDAYDSTIKLMGQLKDRGIKTAIISSSKNLPLILEKINIHPLYETYISGHDITKGKPDPQIFQMAAERLDVSCVNSVVFEDAVLGVEAAKRAGMRCIGVDRYNKPERLNKADAVVSDLSEVSFEKIAMLFKDD
ncbi:MAG: HAD-IA family hydrolase, partial [Candidatus Omnitrophota bacterium]